MPSYDPDFFNTDPYYDDFDESKKFLKFLFRPGFALQARELTQIQSILQNQIERMGNFVFDEGSIVSGGQITEIPTFVSGLSGLSGGSVVVGDIRDSIVQVTKDGGSTAYAKIIYSFNDGSDDIIYYQYVSGNSLTGDNLYLEGNFGGFTFSANTISNIENGLVVHVGPGIRYTNGYFVIHDEQKLGLYEEDGEEIIYQNPSTSVGFDVKKTIITSEQDISLRDPAFGSFNFNAPGADRYKIDLVLNQRGITSNLDTIATDVFSRTDFIEFLRVVDGEVVKKEFYADLGALEETFARRTYDESGHYIVDPFEISTLTAQNSTDFRTKLDSGKAYIFGYEFETQGSTFLTHKKARETQVATEIPIKNEIGPYVLVNFSGISGGLSGFSMNNTFPKVFFDEYSGTETVSENIFDGVRFTTSQFVDIDYFIPGATLYFATNQSSLTGFDGGASAEISAKIFKVESFASGTGENNQYYTTIEIGPQYVVGEGYTFPNGPTSAFFQTESFYVAGGLSFESGLTDTTFLAGQAELYKTTESFSFTGGPLGDEIGHAKIKNIQKQSGESYKLYFTDMRLNENKDITNTKRIFIDGNTNFEPAFYSAQYPNTIYKVNSDPDVFLPNFEEVIKNYSNYDIVFDVHYSNLTYSDSSIVISKLSQAEQIGPNVAGNINALPLRSCNFITLYDNLGELNGNYVLSGGENPNTLTIAPERTPVGNIRASVAQRFRLGDIGTKTNTSNSNVTLSMTGPDEDGNMFSYILDGNGNYLSSVYSITFPTITGQTIPSHYLDGGERDNYIDFAKVIFTSDAQSYMDALGNTNVTVNYYDQTTNGPILIKTNSSSYSGTTYENILNYVSKSGKEYELRNCVDFRPVRYGSDPSIFTLTGPYANHVSINDGYDHSLNYNFYIPRIDKIVLSREKNFKVLEGIPSPIPIPPPDDPHSMTLYTLAVNPYTFSEKDVTIKQEDNRRFTMKDIGNLEKRVESLEYYSKMNFLEQEAKSIQVFDEFGFEVPKKGIFADQFKSNSFGDILSFGYMCSVDKETQELRPSMEYSESSFVDTENGSPLLDLKSGLTALNGLIMLDYTEENFAKNFNPNSSKFVNSNSIVDFNGSLRVAPYADKWFSDSHPPFVKNNFEGENNSWLLSVSKSFSQNANFWDYNWFGKETDPIEKNFKKTKISRVKENKTQKNFGSFTNELSNIKNTQERIVDTSILPYCRERSLMIIAKGLKPNTQHSVYFDSDKASVVSSQPGSITNLVVLFSGQYASGITDENGELQGYLYVPSGKYSTGKKLIRVMNRDSYSDLSLCTSSADAFYYASGVTKEKDSLIYTRPLMTKRESSNSENITTDPLVKQNQRIDLKSKYSKEPISQLFRVNPEKNKGGVYINSVSVLFSPNGYPKSSSGGYEGLIESKLPVVLQLRPVVNGFPSPSKILGESYVYSDQIDSVSDGVYGPNSISGKEVIFKFDNPIYLPPGEYSVSLDSNSSKYSVLTYLVPPKPTSENQSAAIDEAFGKFYDSKNIGNYSQSKTGEYLCCSINRCNFTNTSGIMQFTLPQNNITPSEIDQLHVSLGGNFPAECQINQELDGNSIPTNKTVGLESYDISSSIISYSLQLSSDAKLSPVIDTESSNIVSSRFYSSSNQDINSELLPDKKNTNEVSRYISKNIELLVPAKNVKVVFDKNQPTGTKVEVFMKYVTPNSSIAIDEANYVRLSPMESYGSTTTSDFRSEEYTYKGFIPEFSVFAIKIVFYRESTSKSYPRIRNLKVVAV